MVFTVMKKLYDLGALRPAISKEPLGRRYGRHHKTYLETANKLIAGTG